MTRTKSVLTHIAAAALLFFGLLLWEAYGPRIALYEMFSFCL